MITKMPAPAQLEGALVCAGFVVMTKKQYWATPIAQINRAHKKSLAEMGEEQRAPEWKALYAQRQAVERAFSRLKGQRSLNHIRVRHIRKVTCHCYLSLIAMQTAGLKTCQQA